MRLFTRTPTSHSHSTEAAITRVLEELTDINPEQVRAKYSLGVDIHWHGIGVGICLERGWAIERMPGVVRVTDTGIDELKRRLECNEPRVNPGFLPSQNIPGSTNFKRTLNG
jgi:hypothetical protein